MGEEEVEQQTHLLESNHRIPNLHRTGNVWTSLAHIITAVIGSGVLSLCWSIAQLGWIAGPLTMLFMAAVTFISAVLLSNCYRSPDPDYGPSRNASYLEAVGMILGKRSAWFCSIFMKVDLFKTGVIYIITSGISLRAIERSNCYHRKGHKADCQFGNTSYMFLFGIIQIVTSQIPNFHQTKWLSIASAAMSFTYASIGSGLGLAKVIGNGEIKGSIGGVPTSTPVEKVMLICQAFGNIAFSYPFTMIFFEIEDTLKSPPSEKTTMKKASASAVCITTFFYLCCGGFGYAAFGNSAPGNILTGFGFYEPYWLIDFANACIVLHLIGGFQMYCQPQFAMLEKWLAKKHPNSRFHSDFCCLKLPLLPEYKLYWFRLCYRTAYVAISAMVAMIFPYFNQVLGFAGSLTFWPFGIHFPVEMYIVQKNIRSWTKKWILLRTYSLFGLLLSVLAFVGSMKGLIDAKFSKG